MEWPIDTPSGRESRNGKSLSEQLAIIAQGCLRYSGVVVTDRGALQKMRRAALSPLLLSSGGQADPAAEMARFADQLRGCGDFDRANTLDILFDRFQELCANGEQVRKRERERARTCIC